MKFCGECSTRLAHAGRDARCCWWGYFQRERRLRWPDRPKIVLQWLDTAQGSIDPGEVYKVEDALEAVSGVKYFVDGHDVGSGTVNIFLYAEDSRVDSAISLVIRFFEQGKLPLGMRIGRAMYEDEKRRNWRFQPVYPSGLAEFRIMYPQELPRLNEVGTDVKAGS